MVDTHNRALSKEQERYFRNSALKYNGKLLVFYHGGASNISIFHTMNRPVYFSAVRSYSDEYADPNVYEVYLNVEKPLGRVNRQLADLLINKYKEYCRENHLSINPTWNTPDIENSVGSYLLTTAVDNDKDPDCTFYNFLKATGRWDGLILSEGYSKAADFRDSHSDLSGLTSFVPFYPDQVKATTNKSPTKASNIHEGFCGQTELKQLLLKADGVPGIDRSSEWCVHHLDLQHLHNELPNFALIKRGDHTALHNAIRDGNLRKAVECLMNSYIIQGEMYAKKPDEQEAIQILKPLFSTSSSPDTPTTEALAEHRGDHLKLNPKLFERGYLKESVREALINIASAFVEDLEENEIPISVMDYWLVGSNASYNYSNNSDIDVHIIANMEDIDCNGLLTVVYNYAKSDFNKTHKITVKGIPVEVYIESRSSSSISNGVYSLLENDWIRFPEKIENVPELDKEESELFLTTNKQVLDAVESNNIEEIQDVINHLYLMRKESLVRDGEFGEGNLVFKEFRNNGYLDKLKERKRQLLDKDLTLEQLREGKRMRNKQGQLVVGPGDPVKNAAIFNANMGVSEALHEDQIPYVFHKVDNEHEIEVDGEDVRLYYEDLEYKKWYLYARATYWQPEEYDYTEEEITYTYETDRGSLEEKLWDMLSMDDYDAAESYDRKVNKDGAWFDKNFSTLIAKYGKKIIEAFRDEAVDDAANKVDPESLEPDPPEYEPDDFR